MILLTLISRIKPKGCARLTGFQMLPYQNKSYVICRYVHDTTRYNVLHSCSIVSLITAYKPEAELYFPTYNVLLFCIYN